MIQSLTLMWLGSMGLLTLFGGMIVALRQYQRNESSLVGVIAFAYALLFWALFSMHSTGYLQLIGSGVTQRADTPSFLIIGLIGAVTCLLLLLDGAMRVIRNG
jgi:hypothetical protein